MIRRSLALVVASMFALAIGTLMRHSAGAIFTIVAVFFVVPLIFNIVVQATDAAWTDWVNKLLPSVAGERIIFARPGPELEYWEDED